MSHITGGNAKYTRALENCLPRYLPKEVKACIHKMPYTGMLFPNSPNLETTQMSINQRMSKQIVVYSYKEYFSAIASKKGTSIHKHMETFFKTSCERKEIRPQRVHSLQFHV